MKRAILLVVLSAGCANTGSDRFVMPAGIMVSDEIDMEQACDVVEYLLKNKRELKKNNKSLRGLDFKEITSITKPIIFSERAEKMFPGINILMKEKGCIMSVNWEFGLGKTAVCIVQNENGGKEKYSVDVYYTSSH